MPSKIQMAVFTYDVPRDKSSAYGRIRRQTKRCSLCLTWSAYLIPLSMREMVVKVLQDEQAKTPGMRWSMAKFDDMEEENLKNVAKQAFQNMLNSSKEYLFKAIRAVQEEETTIDHAYAALGKVKKHLADANAIATVFMLNNDLAYALVAHQELINAKTALLEEMKGKKEVKPEPVKESA